MELAEKNQINEDFPFSGLKLKKYNLKDNIKNRQYIEVYREDYSGNTFTYIYKQFVGDLIVRCYSMEQVEYKTIVNVIEHYKKEGFK